MPLQAYHPVNQMICGGKGREREAMAIEGGVVGVSFLAAAWSRSETPHVTE